MKYMVSALALAVLASCTTVSEGPLASITPSNPSGMYTAQVSAVTGYNYGDSREPLMVVENLIREISGDAAKTNALADDMAHALIQNGTTRDGKEFICRQLWIIAEDEHVPHIATLLGNAATADMARYALVNIEGSIADAALVQALGSAPDNVKVGIVNTLGDRAAYGVLGDAGAARRAIKPLRKSGNAALAAAAHAALDRI